MKSDHVAHILKQWAKEKPDLDTSPMGVVGRILRTASFLKQEIQELSDKYDLPSGGFDVLASLRRQGDPCQLSPTQLYKELLITSGAITYRLDQLEKLGYIERIPDPDDRRGTLVALTPEGRECIDQMLEEHLENERDLLSPLTEEGYQHLSWELAKLLNRFEETE